MRSRELKKENQQPERRQVQVAIEEAAGKRIRQLVIQGPPDPDMNDFAVCVSFDDDTMISIELSLLLRFGIFYDRTVDGELQPVKQYRILDQVKSALHLYRLAGSLNLRLFGPLPKRYHPHCVIVRLRA
jgi:hypothetical protein